MSQVDWRWEHSIYEISLHHHWVGTLFSDIEQASIPLMIVITGLLWFLSRPGDNRKWKLACGSAYASAALAYVVAFVIHHTWVRPRPYVTHHIAHPWSNATDASFPSDHSTVSFAIAFAVVLFDPIAGAVFLVIAAIIAVGRLFIGAHYPGDVAAGLAIGALAAIVIVRLLRPFVRWVVSYVERVTDPLVARVYPKRPVT